MALSVSNSNKEFSEVATDGALYDCKASPTLVTAFESKAIRLICSDNELLFSHGEPGKGVYLVLGGEVGLFLPLSSGDGMGFCARSGSFVGLPAAFSNEAYSMTAVAAKGTELALMSREKFSDLVASSPILAMDVLRILAAETRAARITIVEAGIGRRTSR